MQTLAHVSDLHATPVVVVYALASLTLVRMLPVALSLLGARLRWQSVAFLGWFGPRGLATALFALLIVEEIDHTQVEAIEATGASRAQQILFGIVPQVLPTFAGVGVFRWVQVLPSISNVSM